MTSHVMTFQDVWEPCNTNARSITVNTRMRSRGRRIFTDPRPRNDVERGHCTIDSGETIYVIANKVACVNTIQIQKTLS